MKRLVNWIVRSSANPDKLSLTVKGALVSSFSILGTVLVVFGFNNLPANEVSIIVENGAVAIGALGKLIGAVVLIYGALRKVYLTVSTPKI